MMVKAYLLAVSVTLLCLSGAFAEIEEAMSGGCSNLHQMHPPYNGLVYTGSTQGLEPFAVDCQATDGAGTAFYFFDPPDGTVVEISTCHEETDFDTVLVLFEASYYCSDLKCYASNNDVADAGIDSTSCHKPLSSSISFVARDIRYYVMVSGNNGAHGNYGLSIKANLPAEETSCRDAEDIFGPYERTQQVSGWVEHLTAQTADHYDDIYNLDSFDLPNGPLSVTPEVGLTTPIYRKDGGQDPHALGGERDLVLVANEATQVGTIISGCRDGHWDTIVDSGITGSVAMIYNGADDDDGSLEPLTHLGLRGFDMTANGLVNGLRMNLENSAPVQIRAKFEDTTGGSGVLELDIDRFPYGREEFLPFHSPNMIGTDVDFSSMGKVTLSLTFEEAFSAVVYEIVGIRLSARLNDCDLPTSTSIVWYKIYPSYHKETTVTTCHPDTDFDTVIGIVETSCTGRCVGTDAGPCENGADHGSSVIFVPNVAGSAYYIAVGSSDDTIGNFTLVVSQETPAGGDNCGDAISVVVGESQEFSTDGQQYTNICGLSTRSPTKWFRLTPERSGTVEISTCSLYTDFDTALAVVGTCDNLHCVALNDDDPDCNHGDGQSTLQMAVTAGTEYMICVAGYSTNAGRFHLDIEYV